MRVRRHVAKLLLLAGVALGSQALGPTAARAAPPTCTPGPPVRPVAGARTFRVFASCVGKDGDWLAIALALTETTPPTRAATDRLLRALYAQVRRTMGRSFARRVE